MIKSYWWSTIINLNSVSCTWVIVVCTRNRETQFKGRTLVWGSLSRWVNHRANSINKVISFGAFASIHSRDRKFYLKCTFIFVDVIFNRKR